MEGNVLDNITRTSDRVYVSSIERGIVGLSKTGKFISLTLSSKFSKIAMELSDSSLFSILAIESVDNN